MSSEPQTSVPKAELEADIARTRMQLAGTLEALAAKTQVKTRAKDASRDALADLQRRGLEAASRSRKTAMNLVRRVGSFAQTGKGRLSTAGVCAGAITALLAAVRFRLGGDRR